MNHKINHSITSRTYAWKLNYTADMEQDTTSDIRATVSWQIDQESIIDLRRSLTNTSERRNITDKLKSTR